MDKKNNDDTAPFAGDIADYGGGSLLHAVTVRAPAAGVRLAGLRCPALGTSAFLPPRQVEGAVRAAAAADGADTSAFLPPLQVEGAVRAAAAAGAGYALLTARHIPGERRLPDGTPILADGELAYIGEPVAILVGPDPDTLAALLRDTVVDTEPLPADPVFAMDAPDAEVVTRLTAEDNGGAEEGASAADGGLTVAGVYRTGIQEHWYTEPHGALAAPSADGVSVLTAAERPERVREAVALMLNIPVASVTLGRAALGLDMGGKSAYPALVACHAALAASVTRRPVKLMLTRDEDFRFTPKRAETLVRISTRLGADCEPLETAVSVRVNMGAADGAAYGEDAADANAMLGSVARAASGLYRLGRVRVSAEGVRTNLPPAGPFVGLGAAQGAFALERHIALIADTLREDGADWRKRHLNDRKPPAAWLSGLLDGAMAVSDYRRKRAAYELLRRGYKADSPVRPMRGIGIAVFAPAAAGAADGAMAAAVVEAEIDAADFSAVIRGITMAVGLSAARAGGLGGEEALRRRLRRHIVCALGWAASERPRYEDGAIAEGSCADYRFFAPAEPLPIRIDLIAAGADEGVCGTGAYDTGVIDELPYCVIPAAYLQALTQAAGHHFDRLPVSARDIWLRLEERAGRAEPPADEPPASEPQVDGATADEPQVDGALAGEPQAALSPPSGGREALVPDGQRGAT